MGEHHSGRSTLVETVKASSSNKSVRLAGWIAQRRVFEVCGFLICCFASACRDALAPTAHVLPVAPVVRSVQPLPQSVAILPYTPLGSVPLATYDFVEGVLVEATIDGFVHVTSDPAAISVHANADVDYKGVYSFWQSGQCDWAATISSPQLSTPGFQACPSANPQYTQMPRWVDTVVLGGVGGNGTITARRSGGSGDPEYCPSGQPCHTVSGTQTVTLTPLPATIRLISDRTEIAPKTILIPDPFTLPINFTVSSTPGSYHGFTVPRRALSWQWIPASGDSALSTVSCTVPPPSYNSYGCAGYIYERGSLIVSARVNGVVQVDTMKVTGPEVRLNLQKTSMRPSTVTSKINDLQSQDVQVSVVDTSGQPMANKIVRISLIAAEGSAGHIHIDASKPKPTGTILTYFNTGPTGVVTLPYTAPEPSGPVSLKATSNGAGGVVKKIMIEVPDLVSLPAGADYGLVGSAEGMHTANHYATSTHIQMLQRLAAEFRKSFPNAATLKFNDSSLPSGGLFDASSLSQIDKRWQSPHLAHRQGHDTDLRTHDPDTGDLILTDAQKLRIWMIWLFVLPKAHPYQRILDHDTYPQGAPPHFHLSY